MSTIQFKGGALLQLAEESFDNNRAIFECSSCHCKGSFNRDSVKGHRRFKCKTNQCKHSIGIKEILDLLKVDYSGVENGGSTGMNMDVADDSSVSSSISNQLSKKFSFGLVTDFFSQTSKEPSNVGSSLSETPSLRRKIRKRSRVVSSEEDESSIDSAQVKSLQKENVALKQKINSLEGQLQDILTQNNLLSEQILALTASVKELSGKGPVPQSGINNVIVPAPRDMTSVPKVTAVQNPRPTYAAMVKKCNVPDDDAADAIKSLAFLKRRKDASFRPNSTQDFGLVKIYVSGLPFVPIRELKSHLFKLHFMLTKIYHMSYVSKTTVEFLIPSDYNASFRSKCTTYEFNIMAKYDATKPFAQNASKEVVDKVRQGFISRLEKALKNKAINKMASMYYAKWLKEVTGIEVVCAVETSTEESLSDLSHVNVPEGRNGDVEATSPDHMSIADV